MDQLDNRRLGDLVSRVTSDIQAIESFVLTGVERGALSSVARIVFFAGALFVLDWRLALVLHRGRPGLLVYPQGASLA